MNHTEAPDFSGFANEDVGDVGICVFDERGRFLYANAPFLQIRGVDFQAYKTKTAFDLFENNLTDKCILDSVYKRKTPITDLQTVLSDGKVLRTQLVTIYPIFDNEGNIKNAIAYYRNLESFRKFYKNAEQKNGKERGLNKNETIIAGSSSTKRLFQKASDIAKTDATVLITGESGTGKEVLAQYIHQNSGRFDKDMIVVDCTSLPNSLIEAELFGYEKGTFTGATTSKAGLIESAHESTLFLDEINSLPMDLQGKLLRTIETKSVKRLGAIKFKPVDFRLIIATNADLLECVRNATFRLDLYYRINVLSFNILPLRERKEDIELLAKHFEYIFSQKYQSATDLSPKVYSEMLDYDWPGNVRELRNFMERLVIMGPDTTEYCTDNIDTFLQPASSNLEKEQSETLTKADEKNKILEALYINNGHREKTAKYLNISRRSLQYKLKKHSII